MSAKDKFLIGIDFGTLSGRIAAYDLNGIELASLEVPYPDGVIDQTLPGSDLPLEPETALQNPADYLTVIRSSRGLWEANGLDPQNALGIGIDFTACTMMPTLSNGEPLCFRDPWKNRPQAWVKLWKHHAAQPQANRINAIARERNEPFLKAYGCEYSSEWFFSKLLETVEKDPEVYQAADRFMEAGDWLVLQLTGEEKRGASAAGYKAMRTVPDGSGGWQFPDSDFFKALSPLMENVVEEKLSAPYLNPGEKAGGLCAEAALLTGLPEGLPVAVANIDAHAAVPACGVVSPGSVAMIMGTSTCYLALSDRFQVVEGACGAVNQGVIQGAWGYEAGQAAVGDILDWFTRRMTSAEVQDAAKKDNVSLHEWLSRDFALAKPGASGLLALDWWNGSRSVLMDADLSGMILGLTLGTRPADVYRALVESTAYGARKILEAFTSQGLPMESIRACGGLAQKNPALMQIYADVLGREIQVADSSHTSGLGAAMFGGQAAGVFHSMEEAAEKMARLQERTYRPHPANVALYNELYEIYVELHDQMGRQQNSPMKRLRSIRNRALTRPI
jgi:L-ribulokinase